MLQSLYLLCLFYVFPLSSDISSYLSILFPPPPHSLRCSLYNPFLSYLMQLIIKHNLPWGGSDEQRATGESAV